MPLQGPASFIPTTAEFLDHWELADTELGPPGIVIRKQTIEAAADATFAVLDAYYDELVAQHQGIQAVVVEVDLARGALEDLKVLALARLNMFNEKVRALLANTKWERALTEVPSITAGQGVFTDPHNGALALWNKIHSDAALGAGVVLLLRDGTTVAQFETNVNGLDPAYRAVSKQERILKLAREQRNDTQEFIRPILRQYRVVCAGTFAPGSAMMQSLPRMTPEPGHTPEPVAATAGWNATEEKARIDFEESLDPDLDHYEVRYSPGLVYHEDVEDVLGSIGKNEARTFLTSHALALSGATALFRVYVVLTTGNEKGGETLAVTRP